MKAKTECMLISFLQCPCKKRDFCLSSGKKSRGGILPYVLRSPFIFPLAGGYRICCSATFYIFGGYIFSLVRGANLSPKISCFDIDFFLPEFSHIFLSGHFIHLRGPQWAICLTQWTDAQRNRKQH